MEKGIDHHLRFSLGTLVIYCCLAGDNSEDYKNRSREVVYQFLHLHGCQNLKAYETDGMMGKTLTFFSTGLL